MIEHQVPDPQYFSVEIRVASKSVLQHPDEPRGAEKSTPPQRITT